MQIINYYKSFLLYNHLEYTTELLLEVGRDSIYTVLVGWPVAQKRPSK